MFFDWWVNEWELIEYMNGEVQSECLRTIINRKSIKNL